MWQPQAACAHWVLVICPSKLHRREGRVPDFEDLVEQRIQNVSLTVFILLPRRCFNCMYVLTLVHICVSTCIWTHVCMHICLEARGNLRCGSSGAVYLFVFLTVFHNLELTDEPELSGQLVSWQGSTWLLLTGSLTSLASTVATDASVVHGDIIVECHRCPLERTKCPETDRTAW